jgi:hypothetical protein
MGDDIAEAIQALRTSVDVLKANPELLHTPELSFFKDYLQSFGAKIPSPKEQKQVYYLGIHSSEIISNFIRAELIIVFSGG